MRKVIILMAMLISTIVEGQNLVPNPSFEDTIVHGGFCYGPINWASSWFNPNAATPDLFTYSLSTNCTYSSYNNPLGFQLPRTGIGYAGIYGYLGNTREYCAIKLDSILSNGCIYYIEFYVSRANGYSLACDKIGCAFSNDTTGYYLTTGYLSLSPAIQSTPGLLISDTLNWTKINGFYTANGSEKYLLIGNFYDNASTFFDTVDITASSYGAYYYVDDVKVLSCDSSTGLQQLNNNDQLLIWPVPATKFITLTYKGKNKIYEAELFSAKGELLLRQKLRDEIFENTIHLLPFESGLYFLKVNYSNCKSQYFKITISN